jgi:hypothetical protein
MTTEGYPVYAQPDNGRHYYVHGIPVDNRWIVPHNPYILSLYVLLHLSPLSFVVTGLLLIQLRCPRSLAFKCPVMFPIPPKHR